MKVAGKNRANRPFFFHDVDGNRVEFPALGEGSGDLEGAQLAAFNAQVKAGAIVTAEIEAKEQADREQKAAKKAAEKQRDKDAQKKARAEEDPAAKYERLTGKKPDGRWSDERLATELEKLEG